MADIIVTTTIPDALRPRAEAFIRAWDGDGKPPIGAAATSAQVLARAKDFQAWGWRRMVKSWESIQTDDLAGIV